MPQGFYGTTGHDICIHLVFAPTNNNLSINIMHMYCASYIFCNFKTIGVKEGLNETYFRGCPRNFGVLKRLKFNLQSCSKYTEEQCQDTIADTTVSEMLLLTA